MPQQSSADSVCCRLAFAHQHYLDTTTQNWMTAEKHERSSVFFHTIPFVLLFSVALVTREDHRLLQSHRYHSKVIRDVEREGGQEQKGSLAVRARDGG